MEAMTDVPQQSTRNWTRRVRRGLLWTAAIGLLGIALCEHFQPDAFAAVTAIPPWCWLIACVGLGSFGLKGAYTGGKSCCRSAAAFVSDLFG